MDWISHGGELWALLLVCLIAPVALYFLWRVIFAGARAAGQAALPNKTYARVLVPAGPDQPFAPQAVEMACRLAGGGASPAMARVVLLAYVIEVPRALAPDAAMPEEEAVAARELDQAVRAVRTNGLEVIPQVRKARASVDEIVRAVTDERADLLVVSTLGGNNNTPSNSGMGDEEEANGGSGFRLAEMVRRAPCEVMLVRPASDDSSHPVRRQPENVNQRF
jgi:nucleotide-binding universal stress UspA family protein